MWYSLMAGPESTLGKECSCCCCRSDIAAKDIQALEELCQQPWPLTPPRPHPPYALQLRVLSTRLMRKLYRHPFLILVNFIATLVTAIALGLIFRNAGVDTGGIQNRLGCLFFMLLYLSMMSLSSLPIWRAEKLLFIRSPSFCCSASSSTATASGFEILLAVSPLDTGLAIIAGGFSVSILCIHTFILKIVNAQWLQFRALWCDTKAKALYCLPVCLSCCLIIPPFMLPYMLPFMLPYMQPFMLPFKLPFMQPFKLPFKLPVVLPFVLPTTFCAPLQREGCRGLWHARLLYCSPAVRHCAHEGGSPIILRHVQLLDDWLAHPMHFLYLRLHW